MPECSSPISFILLAHVRPFHSWSGSHSRPSSPRSSRLCSFWGTLTEIPICCTIDRGGILFPLGNLREIKGRGAIQQPAGFSRRSMAFRRRQPSPPLFVQRQHASPSSPPIESTLLILNIFTTSVGRPTSYAVRPHRVKTVSDALDAVFRHVCPPSAHPCSRGRMSKVN